MKELLDTRMEVSVAAPQAPPHSIDIAHVTSLSRGIAASVTRLIQRQLGMPGSSVLKDEARRLLGLSLTDVSNGQRSSMVFRIVGDPLDEMRAPTSVALFDLLSGLDRFRHSGIWPRYFHPAIRHSVHEAVEPVLQSSGSVFMAVREGRRTIECPVDRLTAEALGEPEVFSPGEDVTAVGTICDIDMRRALFRVQVRSRIVTVKSSKEQLLTEVDPLRWKRVVVTGVPADNRCHEFEQLESIREATVGQEDGILKGRTISEVNALPAFAAAAERIRSFAELKPGWDTYSAQPPARRLHRAGLDFLRDAYSVLLSYEIDLPAPFVAPTPAGGLQFEWSIGGRELELEVTALEHFTFLMAQHGQEQEGTVERWGAIRLIRWIATGERP